MLAELVYGDHRQEDLFSTISKGTRTGKLVVVIDRINDRFPYFLRLLKYLSLIARYIS